MSNTGITQVIITNLVGGNLSLDMKFAPNRQQRSLLSGVGSTVDIGALASFDEANREPSLTAMRTATPPKISIVQVPGTKNLAGLPSAGSGGETTADSTLAANVIGAATETVHTPIPLPTGTTAVARRLIKFYARLHVIAANGADTWTFRARIGGLTGTLILASAAINITAGDVYTFEGFVEIRTLGGAGTFDSVCRFTDVVNGTASVNAAVLAGAVSTLVSNDLVITGTCSTNNAGNQVSLRHFDVEVVA